MTSDTRHTRRWRTALILGAALATAVPIAAAHADTIKDNFGTSNASVSLGTIAVGGSASDTSVGLTVECSGNSHGARGAVSFNVTTSLISGPQGSASEVSATPSVTLPSTWPADGSGCGNPKPTQSGSTTVQVNVPSTASSGDRRIKVTIDPLDGDISNLVNFTVNYSVPGASNPSDTTPPAAPTVDLVASSDSGVSNSDNVTNDNTPTFQGNAEPDSTVELFGGTSSLGTALADASGNWSITPLTTMSDGVHSITATATDAAGNPSEASGALSVRIDTVKPSVVPGDVNDTTWRNTSLSQAFTASDGGSGVHPAADETFTLIAADESTKDANAGVVPTTVSKTVSDVAGNSTTRSLMALIDKTKPQLGITDNNAASYNVCAGTAPSRPSFNPSDALSGLDPAQTNDSWTSSLQPSGVGSYSYNAGAYDNAGNSDAYAKTYKVAYGDGGTGAYSGIMQPINSDGSSRFKLGSTIPVKFKLLCGTTPIANAVANLKVGKADSTPDPGVDEAISTAASTTGNLFRYDATNQQYIFNLSTKLGYTNPDGSTVSSYSSGTWRLSIVLDDGTHRSQLIQLVR